MRNGLETIKTFEGCRLKAYRCPAGIPTLGWGRTTNVHMGDTMTQAQADAWLDHEYDSFETAVHKAIDGAETTPNQLGAMVSLAYNIGIGNFKASTLLRLHHAGDHKAAAAQFGRWNKAAGKVLAGLTRRRAAEAALYRKA